MRCKYCGHFELPETVATSKHNCQLAIPTVHLNGTSQKQLIEDRTAVLTALEAAGKAIRDGWPHGRDYYVQEPGALARAEKVYQERLLALKAIQAEILQEIEAIQEQGSEKDS